MTALDPIVSGDTAATAADTVQPTAFPDVPVESANGMPAATVHVHSTALVVIAALAGLYAQHVASTVPSEPFREPWSARELRAR